MQTIPVTQLKKLDVVKSMESLDQRRSSELIDALNYRSNSSSVDCITFISKSKPV